IPAPVAGVPLPTNAGQTLTFDAGVTGGTFTLSFGGQTTPPIAWSANTIVLQSNIQAALDALATVGLGNTVVSLSPNPTINFLNALAGTHFSLTLNADKLQGGSAAIGETDS